MPRLAWVTGAGGLIGSHLVRAAADAACDWKVRALTREHLDLSNGAAVDDAFHCDKPGLIVHCAAISRSPVCQADPARAWQLNVQVTEHLTRLAAGIPFVFFSSDLVFDGRTGSYTESAAVNPLSVYAETKVAAEKVVLANPRHTVIRTSLNAGCSPTGDRGLDEQLRLAWARGEKTRLFHDEFRSPIFACYTARAVWELVHQDGCGLFHVAGAERLSRFEIGQLIARRWPAWNAQIEATSLREYQGAPRAADTSLDCAKAQKTLSFRLPGFRECLEADSDDGP